MLERNAAALQYYIDLIHRSRAAQAKSAEEASDPSEPSFEKRLSAMIFAGRPLCVQLTKNEGLGWDVSPMPKNLRRATTLSVRGYGISSFTKNPDAAWKLVRFLTSPTSQTKLAMTGRCIPARVSAGQSRVFLDFPGKLSINNRAFIDGLFYARPLETAPRWTEVEKIVAEETDLLFSTGKGSARDSLIRAQNRIDKLMAAATGVPRLTAPPERKSVPKKK
jgi:ABC-type glycerol-3-phosphate transport system substrate-binding protein